MNKYERLIKDLEETGQCITKVFGQSMMPKIKSGSTITFQKQDHYEIGDFVFCRVKGVFIDCHQITKIDSKGRYLISNNKGYDNGWTSTIFAKAIKIDP